MISAQLVTEQTREIHPHQNSDPRLLSQVSTNNCGNCSQKVPLGEAAFLLGQAAEEVVGPGDMHRVLLDLQQPHQQRDQIGAAFLFGSLILIQFRQRSARTNMRGGL